MFLCGFIDISKKVALQYLKESSGKFQATNVVVLNIEEVNMKYRLFALLVMFLSAVAFGSTDYGTPIGELIKAGILLGMLTGVIPGVVFLIVVASIKGGIKTGKKIAATDFTPITEKDKREQYLDALGAKEEETEGE